MPDEGIFKTSSKRFLRDLPFVWTGYESTKDTDDTVVSDFETELNKVIRSALRLSLLCLFCILYSIF